MTGSQVDVPPKSGTSPVMDWGQEIAKQAGSPPRPVPSLDVPKAEAVDKPPGGTERNDELHPEVVADMQHNRGLREKYADKAYKLATGCIQVWAIVIGMQGIMKAILGIEMWSDKVLIAITTGVTVSVLAAFLGVIRGLFGGNHSNGKEKK